MHGSLLYLYKLISISFILLIIYIYICVVNCNLPVSCGQLPATKYKSSLTRWDVMSVMVLGSKEVKTLG